MTAVPSVFVPLLLLASAAPSEPAALCAESGAGCSASKCCADEGDQCFQKDEYWAACRSECAEGQPQEGDEGEEPWSCSVLTAEGSGDGEEGPEDEEAPEAAGNDPEGEQAAQVDACAADGEDCSASRCCADENLKCFAKNENWAGCKPDCTPGVDGTEDDGLPWSCSLLGPPTAAGGSDEAACAAEGDDCTASGCCATEGLSCFRKDDFWASCRQSCSPGVDPADEDQTPWSCDLLGPAPAPASQGGEGAVPAAEPAAEENPVADASPDLRQGCAESGSDCTSAKCCQEPGVFCFEKDQYFAQCKSHCSMAPNKDGVSWTCEMLLSGHAADGTWDKAAGKARWLLSYLRPEAKTALLHGANGDDTADRWGYLGLVNPQAETRLPDKAEDGAEALRSALAAPLRIAAATQGFSAPGSGASTATRFPAGLALAATFDPHASAAYAKALADEFRAKGANVLLGPDVTVVRAPLSGRSYESISGEDPYLGSQMAKPFVKTLQDAGIIAAVKHWLNSNQDTYQKTMNVAIDVRAQREIYTRPFEAAFAAGAGAVVCPYNKVNGARACESGELLQGLLRDALGFRGFVVSEWDAVQDLGASAAAGVDVEMPGGSGSGIASLMEQGLLNKDQLNDKVVRVLGSLYAAGHFRSRFHAPSSLRDALNDGVDGYNGMKSQRGAAMELLQSDTSSQGASVARQTIISGAVLLKNKGGTLPIAKGAAKIALLGKCAEGTTGDKSTRLLMHTSLTSLQGALKDAVGDQGTQVASSGDAAAARGSSVAVVCAMALAAEGWDRDNLSLPDVDWLIADARKNGAKKVVVLAITPGAVTTEWVAGADAALLFFAPGGQLGPAAAALLVGAASPGGRLPVTLPEADEKRFTASQYPGECEGKQKWCEDLTANFSESTLVGYRWNDAMKVKAAFPFGFGLDYTEFSYDGFRVDCSSDAATVKVTVSNVGGREGTAVPQAYVQFDRLRPAVRQLRGFRKVVLPAGGKAEVTFVLREEDWRFYDASAGKWRSAVHEGDFVTVHVGSSSADLLWSETLSCDFVALKDNSGLLRPLVMG